MLLSHPELIESLKDKLFIPPFSVKKLSGDTSPFSSMDSKEIDDFILRKPTESNLFQILTGKNVEEKSSSKIQIIEDLPAIESPSEKEEDKKEEESPKEELKKYRIYTDSTSTLKLPEFYSTDDIEEKEIIDLLNGKTEYAFDLVINEESIKCYKAELPDETQMLKSEYDVQFPIEVVKEAFFNHKIREKWDKGMKKDQKELSKKEENGCVIEEIYMLMHFPFPMTNRDCVFRRKTWKEYVGTPKRALSLMKSFDHPDYPEKDKPIRAIFYIAGYYFEEVNPHLTRVLSVTHADVKLGKKIKSFANKKASENSKKFIEGLIKGCQIVQGKK